MSRKKTGTIWVTVVEAKDIMKADLTGSSDPYVQARIVSMLPTSEVAQKTKIQKKTLSPRWDEKFKFLLSDADNDKLELKLYDYDMVGSNKLLGFLEVPISACFGRPRVDEWRDWHNPKKHNKTGKGSVHLILQYEGQGQVKAQAAPVQAPAATLPAAPAPAPAPLPTEPAQSAPISSSSVPNFCSDCGTKVTGGNFCSNCGAKLN